MAKKKAPKGENPPQEEDEHSLYGPSGADQWFNCTAAPRYVEKLRAAGEIPKDTGNDSSRKGSAAHELLETCVISGDTPEVYRGQIIKKTHEADDEMINGVTSALIYIDQFWGSANTSAELWAEMKFPLVWIDQKGTADIVIWDPDEMVLHIMDYKNGRGFVPVEKNKQVGMYALGAIDELKINPKKVFLHILQPNVSGPTGRMWQATKKWLAALKKESREKYLEGEAGGVFNPGELQCKWCDARGHCKKYAKWTIAMAGGEFAEFIDEDCDPELADSNELGDDELVALYKNLAAVEKWTAGIRERVVGKVHKGELRDHFKLVEGTSNRKWKDEETVKAAMKRLKVKIDAYMPRKLAGIGAIEKLIPVAERKTLMPKLTDKPRGEPQVADIDDPRPSFSKAEEDFNEFLD